jgi:adenylate cyclase
VLYLFEDYALDTNRRELRRGSALLAVEPQVFDLLVFLVGSRDRVVSKEDLIDAVWGGRIVSDSTLDSRINAARRTIGDNGRQQRLIRTIIGKGVRFVGEAQEQPAAGVTVAPSLFTAHQAVVAATRRWPAMQAIAIAGAALTVVLAAALWWAWPSAAPRTLVSQPAPVVKTEPPRPAPRLSIVVLPFKNLSNDPEQEYFVDAVTDDLTTDLSRVVNSFVIARTTAFSYRDKAVDVTQLGRELGVRYVLEGNVQRHGEQVQINVQLIDAENGGHIWADRLDTDRANLPSAQNEIIARLARALELQLIEVVGRQIEQDKPVNLDARDLVMHGWAYYNRPQTKENLQLALTAFEKALATDPESIDARAGIARVLGELLATGTTPPAERAAQIERADRLLGEALERDRNNAEAHASLGRIRRIQGRLIESRIELEKAIALDRNHELAIIQYGITSLLLGEPDVALPFFEKFLQINPRSQNLFFIYYWLGHTHLFLFDTDEAISMLRQAYSANPGFPPTNFMLAAALGLRGDLDEAKVYLSAFFAQRPQFSSFRLMRENSFNWDASPAYVSLREKTVDVGLRRAGMPEE